MSAIFIVLPLALCVSALAVGAFVWAVRRGEFDDLETPARRMLADDATSPVQDETPEQQPED